MEISAECRWFWRQEASSPYVASFKDWFIDPEIHKCPPGGGEEHVDKYLVDKKQSELSIKRRGEKPGVEVKGLVRRMPTSVTIVALTAPIEIWTKWTSEVLTIDSFPTIGVKKTRWLRKFELTSNQLKQIPLGKDERPADGRPLPQAGSNVELTFITTRGRDQWLTFNLEAFGDLESATASIQYASVEMTSSDARRSIPGGALIASYAEWLNSHGISHD